MNHSFKNKLFVLMALLALIVGALGITPAKASITVADGMAATLVLGQPNFTSVNSGASATRMNAPYDVAVDPTTGKVFVAERSNNRVLRFASADTLSNGAAAEAVLGQPDFTSNVGSAAANRMSQPMGIDVDSAGRLWVADGVNHRVLRFDNASSIASGSNADIVLGQASFGTNGSATSQTGMNMPQEVQIDSAGRLWVTEYGNSRVTRFDNAASLGNGAPANGVLGQPDFVTNTTAAAANKLSNPWGSYVDSSGRLWVPDQHSRLLRFDNAAAKSNGAAADGVLGQPNFTSSGGATAQNRMNFPTGVTGDDSTGRIYVSESWGNNRILVFDNAASLPDGSNASYVIGQTNFTSSGWSTTQTGMRSPMKPYFDPIYGVLWVAEQDNHRVTMFGTPVPPTPAAPTVSTDSIETLNNRQVNATLSDLGYPASVTAHGVVYNTTGTPTTSDSKVDKGATSSTGAYTVGLDEMNLTSGTQYFVRAFATNATGTSYGSELVVYGVPGAFTHIAPLNNATDVSTSPTLSWNASTGATDYQYCAATQLSDCTSNMTGPNWHSTSGATSANLSGLLSSTNYVWAVRAVVGTPASYKFATSAPFNFTTASAPSQTVTFNGNGSNGGSMSSQSANAATALTANAFTRTDYTFTGWNTAANGSGTSYANNAVYNFSADITLYAQWTITNSAILPSPWLGSMSVSADKNVVAVGRPHIGSEIASYDGLSSGSLSAYVPMLFKDAFGGSYDAALYVQNVSGSSANVTIKFYDSAGTLSCTKNDTVSSLASKGYWLPSESCLPAGWVGSALITSDQNIVTISRPHVGSEVMTYNGFSSGSTSASIPMLFKDAFGGSYDSAFYIQNTHSSNTATLTIQFYDSAGTLSCTKNDSIAPLASKGYWVPSESCLPTGWIGGVVVTSDQPIVSIGRSHIGSQITTHNGFSSGSTSAFIPMLFKDAFGGSYDAAFYLQNVHAVNTANITIKYYDNAGTLNCTKADTLAPLASKGYWVPSATCDSGSLPVGWVGSVEVTSDQPITGVGRPHVGSQVTTYNGFSSGSSSSFLSMLFKDAFGGSYDSAFYVQNTEATQAIVTTNFYDSAGALTCSRTDTIQPKATLGIWVPSATCEP